MLRSGDRCGGGLRRPREELRALPAVRHERRHPDARRPLARHHAVAEDGVVVRERRRDGLEQRPVRLAAHAAERLGRHARVGEEPLDRRTVLAGREQLLEAPDVGLLLDRIRRARRRRAARTAPAGWRGVRWRPPRAQARRRTRCRTPRPRRPPARSPPRGPRPRGRRRTARCRRSRRGRGGRSGTPRSPRRGRPRARPSAPAPGATARRRPAPAAAPPPSGRTRSPSRRAMWPGSRSSSPLGARVQRNAAGARALVNGGHVGRWVRPPGQRRIGRRGRRV